MKYGKSIKNRGAEHPALPAPLKLSWGALQLHGPSAEVVKIFKMFFGILGVVVVAAAVIVVVAMGSGTLDELALLVPRELTVTFQGSLE